MSTILLIYFTLGLVTNLYYLAVNNRKYTEAIESGELKPISLFIGVALTQFLWPISIYNNEFRDENKED
jgi:hypothetical protein